MLKHFNIKILGRVHGVGFRYSCHKQAQKLSLAGFVRNETDRTVYAEVEGEDVNIQKFISWCKKGPLFAKVERVEAGEGPMKNFSEFSIKEN